MFDSFFKSISRGWRLFKLSAKIILEDKKLIVFPILSGIFSILLLIGMIAPFLVVGLVSMSSEGAGNILVWVLLFVYYFATAFLSIFFNVALVHSLKSKLDGNGASVGQSLGFAMSRFFVIAQWAVLSAIVGIILRMIERAGGRNIIGRIIAAIIATIIGAAWSILTFFVIPVLVYENLGVFATLKKSAQIFKNTWGEVVGAGIGSGFVFFLLFIAWAVLFFVLSIVFAMIFPLGIIFTLLLFFVGIVILVLFSRTVSSVTTALLYLYASQQIVLPGFTEDEMKDLFGQPKPKQVGLFGAIK
ncbi:MAG TPA: DUF6159 family protein [archaeon]|nr:DUF6159 family protein [archaeon]